jgi:hypothetical protein
VSVQHQVGSVLVEQLPKGLSGQRPLGDAVRSAERGLMPVRGCASGMILLEILFSHSSSAANQEPVVEQPPGCVSHSILSEIMCQEPRL